MKFLGLSGLQHVGLSLQVKDKLLRLLLIMTQKVGFVNLGGNTYIPPLNVSLGLII